MKRSSLVLSILALLPNTLIASDARSRDSDLPLNPSLGSFVPSYDYLDQSSPFRRGSGSISKRWTTQTPQQAVYSAGILTALQVGNDIAMTMILQNTLAIDLLDDLAAGEGRTLFAPNDAALTAEGILAANVTQGLMQRLAYHVARGSYDADSIPPGQTFVTRTTYNSQMQIGGQPQVLTLSKDPSNGALKVSTGSMTANIVASTSYQNTVIHTIDRVLSPPTSFKDTVTNNPSLGATIFTVVTQMMVPDFASSVESTGNGITIFAPIDASLADLGQLVGGLPSATIQWVLRNHVINGTSLYSGMLSNSTYSISCTGQPLSFWKNDQGTFIRANNSTAKVLVADIPIENGVLHIIDNVLISTSNDPAAAAKAASQNINLQSSSSPQTGFLTLPPASLLTPTSILPMTTSAPLSASVGVVGPGGQFASLAGATADGASQSSVAKGGAATREVRGHWAACLILCLVLVGSS